MRMVWSDIIIEGYCTCKKKKDCPKKIVREKVCGKLVVTSRPVRERLFPEYWCLANDCKRFGCCDAEKQVYLWVNKYYKKGDKK